LCRVCAGGMSDGGQIEPTTLVQDKNERWLIMDFSGVIICMAYLAPSVNVAILEKFATVVGEI
jgi:hypothetical protein